jgi:hypothetical protein
VFRNRKYKSGTGWCIWRWSDVDNEFIRRLHVIKTPWFAICLHWILKPDPEPYLHDHPVSLLSFILRGWYIETRTQGPDTTVKLRKWWNFIHGSRSDRHTITACDPRTVTLAFMGPKVREWGYHTDEGWIHWKAYSHDKYRKSPSQ